MNNNTINRKQGHWILAKMGKKVLRPGGKELTLKMIENLNIIENDHIVEFAPGLGFTAEITLRKGPTSYTGVELNEAAVRHLQNKISGKNIKFIEGNAAETGLENNVYTKVYGEAMLTMQSDNRKSIIIREAARILEPGGLYGIHELGLYPDDISNEIKEEIHKSLAKVIKVNARPLTQAEWKTLLEKEGFEIIKIETSPMHLLEAKRVLDDEGLFRTLKIIFNVLTHRDERRRILAMRKIFRKYQDHLNAISIVAKKL